MLCFTSLQLLPTPFIPPSHFSCLECSKGSYTNLTSSTVGLSNCSFEWFPVNIQVGLAWSWTLYQDRQGSTSEQQQSSHCTPCLVGNWVKLPTCQTGSYTENTGQAGWIICLTGIILKQRINNYVYPCGKFTNVENRTAGALCNSSISVSIGSSSPIGLLSHVHAFVRWRTMVCSFHPFRTIRFFTRIIPLHHFRYSRTGMLRLTTRRANW